MRALILKMSITLDGFVCGPNGEMDWFLRTRSEEAGAWMAEKVRHAGAHLVGRKTFCDWLSFWPQASGAFAGPMNEIPKIVFSKQGFDLPPKIDELSTLSAEKAKTWKEARVLSGDLSEEILRLKSQEGPYLVAHGGADFVQNLVQTGLVDEFWLARHSVAIGRGQGLFDRLKAPLFLQETETKTFSSGTVVSVYKSKG